MNMRRAKSYSIVDHQLLHGKYLHRLSHPAMSLYLFLIVVADKEGKSFYGDSTITKILRLEEKSLEIVRQELIKEGLIFYSHPFWWVKNLTETKKIKIENKKDISPQKPTDRENAKNYINAIRQLLKL